MTSLFWKYIFALEFQLNTRKVMQQQKLSCYLSQISLICNLSLIKDFLIKVSYMRSSSLTDLISYVVNNKYLLFFCKANWVKSSKYIFMGACCTNCKTVASNYFAMVLVLLYVLFIIILPMFFIFTFCWLFASNSTASSNKALITPSGKRRKSDHNHDITWQIQQFRIINLALTPYWNLMVLSTILQSVLQQRSNWPPNYRLPHKSSTRIMLLYTYYS